MTNELQYFVALKRIASYLDPEKLRKQSDKLYGLGPDEAVEMAYENVLYEARDAIKGKRMPKTKVASA